MFSSFRRAKSTSTVSEGNSKRKKRRSLKKFVRGQVNRKLPKDDDADQSVYSIDVDALSVAPSVATTTDSTSMASSPSRAKSALNLGDISTASMIQAVVLLLDPKTRRFELLQLELNGASSVVGDILHRSMKAISEDSIKNLNFTGVCRPNGEVLPADKGLEEVANDNSMILIAMPEGAEAAECSKISKPVLMNNNVLTMLRQNGINLLSLYEKPVTAVETAQRKLSKEAPKAEAAARELKPIIAPKPEPKPVVQPVSEPKPIIAPKPEPKPIIAPKPDPKPVVQPVPEPEPAPVPKAKKVAVTVPPPATKSLDGLESDMAKKVVASVDPPTKARGAEFTERSSPKIPAPSSKKSGYVLLPIVVAYLLVLAGAGLVSYHKVITTPLKPGDSLAPGMSRTKCGLLSVLPSPETVEATVAAAPEWLSGFLADLPDLPSCEEETLVMGSDGVLSLEDSEGNAIWKMVGETCAEDNEACKDGLVVAQDGSVIIGEKTVKKVTTFSGNGSALNPWPFAATPKKMKTKVVKN